MNCLKVTHLLSAFLDGELPGVEHRLIHQHLQRCDSCRSDYEDLLQMKRLLGRLRIQSAHSNLPMQILQQVHSEEARVHAAHSADRINELVQRLRSKVSTPQTISLGLGFAVVAALYMAQINGSPQQSTDITWLQSPPTVHEFVNGIHYADSERFLSRPNGAAIRAVSSGGFFAQQEDLFQRHNSSVQLEQLVFHPR